MRAPGNAKPSFLQALKLLKLFLGGRLLLLPLLQQATSFFVKIVQKIHKLSTLPPDPPSKNDYDYMQFLFNQNLCNFYSLATTKVD